MVCTRFYEHAGTEFCFIGIGSKQMAHCDEKKAFKKVPPLGNKYPCRRRFILNQCFSLILFVIHAQILVISGGLYFILKWIE